MKLPRLASLRFLRAAERRQEIATGVSPWKSGENGSRAPEGAAQIEVRFRVALARAPVTNRPQIPGLTAGAISCRPSGTQKRNFKDASRGRVHPLRLNTVVAE